MIKLILNLILLLFAIVKYSSLIEIESYTVIPNNNPLCDDKTLDIGERKFEVFNKINFSSGLYSSNVSRLSYTCISIVLPMGKLIKHSYSNMGHASFWFLRFKVNVDIKNCNDRLTILLSPNLLQGENGEVIVFDCSKKSQNLQMIPMVYNTSFRLMHITWETENGRFDTGSSFSLHVVTHMIYEGNFTDEKRKQLCDRQAGVWCGNETQVCVSKVQCDGVDDCFDGGTDELNCPPKSNTSYVHGGRHDHNYSEGWTANLPWIVLGILPVILLFALARICSQKRQLDVSEDYKESSSSDEGDCIIVAPGSSAMTASWKAANGEGVGLYYKGDRGSPEDDHDEETETVEDVDDKQNDSVALYPPRCDSEGGTGLSCSNVVVMRVDHHDNRSLSTNSCASASGTAITLTTTAGGAQTNHTEDSDDYDYPSPDNETETKFHNNESKRNSKMSNCSPKKSSVSTDVNNPIYGSQDQLSNGSPVANDLDNIPPPSYEDCQKLKDPSEQSSTPLLENGKNSHHSNPDAISSKRNSRESAKSGARDSAARVSLLSSNGVANAAGKEPDYDRDYIVV